MAESTRRTSFRGLLAVVAVLALEGKSARLRPVYDMTTRKPARHPEGDKAVMWTYTIGKRHMVDDRNDVGVAEEIGKGTS